MVKKKFFKVWVVAGIVLAVLSAFFVDMFIVFDHMVYDSLYESEDDPLSSIVIVGIDNLSYQTIGRWPFSREIQSQIMDKILEGEPSVLGVDLVYDSRVSEEEDDFLVNSMEGEPVVLASILLDESKSSGGVGQQLVLPFDELSDNHNTGYINTKADASDGVVRKILLKTEREKGSYIESFSYKIYLEYIKAMGIKNEINTEQLTKDFYIDYAGGTNTMEVVSAQLVLNGTIPPSLFEDRIVLFGPYTIGMQDDYYTSIDKVYKTYGVEIHANVIQNLIENNLKTDMDSIFELVMIIVCGMLTYYLAKKLPIKYTIVLQLILIFAVMLIGKQLYNMGIVAHIIYSIITIVSISLVMIFIGYMEQSAEKRRITSVFERYVAPQIVDEILDVGEEQLKLGGKRKDITVLFVDIRGFTPLSEVVEPEEVVQILNEYLELCTQAIFDHKGTLDKFIGDAAMAVYNAPVDLEDHAYHAVKTAYQMKVQGEELKKSLYKRFKKEVQFGIGVNTGKAVVGNIGSNVRMDYTAIGDAVNTAARLESNAKPGQILISYDTYQLVKDKVEVDHMGLLKVKGKELEVDVYEVLTVF